MILWDDRFAGQVFNAKTIYNCNCCGCTFEENEAELKDDEITCPECGCRYDEDNEYIEKNNVFLPE